MKSCRKNTLLAWLLQTLRRFFSPFLSFSWLFVYFTCALRARCTRHTFQYTTTAISGSLFCNLLFVSMWSHKKHMQTLAQTATRKKKRNVIETRAKHDCEKNGSDQMWIVWRFSLISRCNLRVWIGKWSKQMMLSLHFQSIIDFPNWVIESCWCLGRAPDQINSKGSSWVALT